MPRTIAPKKKGASTRDRVQKHRAQKRAMEIPRISKTRYAVRRRLEKKPERWLKYYWPGVYVQPFGEPHRKIIEAINHAIDKDQNFAVAMARGWGKTSTALGGVLHAIITGRCSFPLFIAKTGGQAQDLLTDAFKFLTTEKFVADYPEIGHAFARATSSQAFAYQVDQATGKAVGAGRTRQYLRFPDLPVRIEGGGEKPNPAAGAYLWGSGITGDGIRGAHIMTGSGAWLRPDVALVDDPETPESAASVAQCEQRLGLIKKDISGCGAQGKSIPIIVPTTVQRRGCVGDQLLDHNANPDFHGLKVSAVGTMPKNLDLWEQDYNAERVSGIADQEGGARAARFYRKHRKQLDDGCTLSWAGFDMPYGCVSKIQAAMNYYLSNPGAFFSEWQQDPQDSISRLYSVDEITVANAVSGLPRGAKPKAAVFTSIGIDINDYALSFAVVASDGLRACTVVDYAQWPGDTDLWNDRMNITRSAAVTQGLITLCELLAKRYGPDRFVIDGNGEISDTVYAAIPQIKRKTGIDTCAGRGTGSQYYYLPASPKNRIKAGELCHLMQQKKRGGKLGRSLFFDSHHWHKESQLGFLLPPGSPGCVCLNGKPGEHQKIATHICADRLISMKLTDAGKEVMTWEKEDGIDNDLGDAIVLAMVGIAVEGYTSILAEEKPKDKPAGKGIIRIPKRR